MARKIMRTKIWAHRGASIVYPENSMAAFERALELGVDGLELDVHLSKDEVPVVIHDESFDRTSAGRHTGRVCDYAWEECRNFNLALHHHDRAHPLPSLQMVLERFKDTQLSINIELKTDVIVYPNICERVLEVCDHCSFPKDRLLFSSFHSPTLEHLHELDPTLKMGFLFKKVLKKPALIAEKVGAIALHPHFALLFLPFYLGAARRKFSINSWTVDHPLVMRLLIWRGIEGLITNDSALALKIRDGRQAK